MYLVISSPTNTNYAYDLRSSTLGYENQADFRMGKINPSIAITPCSSIDDLLSIYMGIKLLPYFPFHWFTFGEILSGSP